MARERISSICNRFRASCSLCSSNARRRALTPADGPEVRCVDPVPPGVVDKEPDPIRIKALAVGTDDEDWAAAPLSTAYALSERDSGLSSEADNTGDGSFFVWDCNGNGECVGGDGSRGCSLSESCGVGGEDVSIYLNVGWAFLKRTGFPSSSNV
jgi:hypothetical protein